MQTRNLKYLPIIGFLLNICACSTPPPPVKVDVQERILHDNRLGLQLAQKLEPQLVMKVDVEVAVYLRTLAQKLSENSVELKSSPVGVLLVANGKKKWMSFSLPGNRIYLSLGLLKKLEFEHEVAAIMAIELAHILRRTPLERLEGPTYVQKPVEMESLRFFGPDGIFSYSDQAEFEAVKVAAELLYKAGFDSRGLVGVWEVLRSHLDKSPYGADMLDKLLEKSREAIALYTPLRNPIVKRDVFISIRKRIKRL